MSAKFFDVSNPDVNISIDNGNIDYNGDVQFNGNVLYNGGGQIGFNPEYPNELVISADGFEVDGSCISIFQQDKSDTQTTMGITHNTAGDIRLYARNYNTGKVISLQLMPDRNIVYVISRYNATSTIDNGTVDFYGYVNAIQAESYSSNSWYRKYANGWVEQGGRIVVNSASVAADIYSTATLTFPVPFTKCYHWLCQAKHDRFNAGFSASDNITSSVSVYQVNDSGTAFVNPFVIWYAVGYWK